MNQDLTPKTLSMLVFSVSVCIFIMPLPALLELKKPKDTGSRMIMDGAVVPSLWLELIRWKTRGENWLERGSIKQDSRDHSCLTELRGIELFFFTKSHAFLHLSWAICKLPRTLPCKE
jgi:hypothetical protein